MNWVHCVTQCHLDIYTKEETYNDFLTHIIYKFQFQKLCLYFSDPSLENTVIYPPNGVIPFHGFAMYCVPLCYVYDDPRQLFYSFRAFYLQFSSKLHEVSSDQQGIVSLCALFEQLVTISLFWSLIFIVRKQLSNIHFSRLHLKRVARCSF